jgi:hypothetical protein
MPITFTGFSNITKKNVDELDPSDEVLYTNNSDVWVSTGYTSNVSLDCRYGEYIELCDIIYRLSETVQLPSPSDSFAEMCEEYLSSLQEVEKYFNDLESDHEHFWYKGLFTELYNVIYNASNNGVLIIT